MLRRVLTPHAGAKQVDVDAGPRGDAETIDLGGEPVHSDRRKRPEHETTALDGAESGGSRRDLAEPP